MKSRKNGLRILAGVLALVFAAFLLRGLAGEAKDMTTEKPANRTASAEMTAKAEKPESVETATFGAGCFWGVEAAFRKVEGVVETAVGYSGGHYDNPTYRDVCSGRTGHAEVVRVTFDPEKVTYDGLLEVFWQSHDPTQVNRQGPDVGYQYRSVVFYHSPEQGKAAEASKRALEDSGKHPRPVATSVEPAQTFWKAEEYHQQYLEKKGVASCHIGLQ